MEFSAIDTLWVLLGAALVYFMQAGFAMVETGFTRAKNAGNIIMKNLMDFAAGSVVYWALGFGLMFGTTSVANGFIGGIDPFTTNISAYDTATLPGWAIVIFQTVFCATAATIVSGAMAERTKFKAYLVYSIAISAIIYPISGHWIWGGGWLSTLSIGDATGFIDFAGSTAVHMVGGVSAFIGALILGPRIGKYSAKTGKSRAIPGHSLTLGALGVFILWFGWFGFNGASTLGMEGQTELAARVFMTTNISAACAACVVMAISWIKYKKPDVSMTLNGVLGGLVAITAGCATVEPWAAAIIGVIAGIAMFFAIEFIDKKLKVDDPVGAVGVHGVCGALGTILVGFFAKDNGLLTTGNASQLAIQCVGVFSVMAWVAVTITIVFLLIKKTIGLRVSPEEELIGLDLTEHGLASSYADFMPPAEYPHVMAADSDSVDISDLKADGIPAASDLSKYTKLAVVCNESKLGALKNALGAIGVTGITVTRVQGCGIQRGKPEYYRGVELEMTLLPKIKVEIVVCKVPVEIVVETIKRALRTGHIGDGKIFLYDVENVIKVRTGEEGYDALLDD